MLRHLWKVGAQGRDPGSCEALTRLRGYAAGHVFAYECASSVEYAFTEQVRMSYQKKTPKYRMA
jgi:hypothetical protein